MTSPNMMDLFAQVARSYHTEPHEAAIKLREIAARMIAIAEKLEKQNANPFSSEGGLSNRVLINVVGPDGNIKQSIDAQG